jgi:nitrate reductase gamma subunit
VAFQEEPWALSKNFTGLLLTLGMVVGAALCCAAFGLLRQRLFAESARRAKQDADDFGAPSFVGGYESSE